MSTKMNAVMAALSKTVLGGGAASPQTVRMPRAVAELHVAPDAMIPAGTVISDEIAELADLDQDTLDQLERAGHVEFVEVYAAAAATAEA